MKENPFDVVKKNLKPATRNHGITVADVLRVFPGAHVLQEAKALRDGEPLQVFRISRNTLLLNRKAPQQLKLIDCWRQEVIVRQRAISATI